MILEARIALTTYEGAVVSAPPFGEWALVADRRRILGWEVLAAVAVGGGQVAFRTAHGFYVSARDGLEGWVLEGYSPVVRDWERFTPVITAGYVALQTAHGRFVGADPIGEGGRLRGESTEVGEPQRFGGGGIEPAPPEGAPAAAFVPFAPGGWTLRRPVADVFEELTHPGDVRAASHLRKDDQASSPARHFDRPVLNADGMEFRL